MVVLEAAAIGAAGYGLYRGGDAAVRRGKESIKEYKREQKRSEQRSELSQKIKARSERIAQLASIRRGESPAGAPSFSSSLPETSAVATGNFRDCSNSASNPTNGSSASLTDRHKNVMEKLRSSRRDESMKSSSSGKFNLFKKN